MTNILSEKDYQKFFLERLEKDNGYVVRKAAHFDRSFAMGDYPKFCVNLQCGVE